LLVASAPISKISIRRREKTAVQKGKCYRQLSEGVFKVIFSFL
jgi:hypothetical protein